MKKHQRKIALIAALALLFGSAAASAANYSAGRGALPSFAGAGDALDIAMNSASNASSWLITRARSTVGSAFAYPKQSPARPAEVASAPDDLPMFQRGSVDPVEPTPHWRPLAGSAIADNVHAPTFDDGAGAPASPGVPSVDVTLPSLPGNGGGGERITPTIDIPDIAAPVPELPPFALLLAGLGAVTAIARRRRTA